MLYGYKIAAVCISKMNEEYIRLFIESLSKTLNSQGWRAMVFMTGTDLYSHTPSNKGEETVFDLMDFSVIDAVVMLENLLFDEECREKIIRRTKEAGVPMLVVNGLRDDCNCLNFDYPGGFAKVVRHLVEEHNIRDFHMIAGNQGNSFSEARIEMMRSIMKEYDIPFGDDRLSYGDFWSDPAILAVRCLIDENRLPRAIVCANDVMALAICQELLKRGYRIPEDVIVTGFAGIEEIWYSVPKITSASSNYGMLGKMAAEICIESVEEGVRNKKYYLLPELIIQESCGCPMLNKRDPVEYLFRQNNVFNRYYHEAGDLNEISARIQLCDTLEQVTAELHDQILYCIQVFLKEECINSSLDPTVQHSATTFGEEVYSILDTNHPEHEGSFIKTKDLITEMEWVLRLEITPIFIALHDIDLPLGYICYVYEGYYPSFSAKANSP